MKSRSAMTRQAGRVRAFYMATMFFYYIVFACFGAFGNFFMLARGLTESSIGLVFAVASLVSMLVQATQARVYKDRPGTTSKDLMLLTLGLGLALSLAIGLVRSALATAIFFALAWAMLISLVPLFSTLFIEYTSRGYDLSFNLARAGGSLSYALAAIGLGRLFTFLSHEALIGIIILSLGLVIGLSLALPDPERNFQIYRGETSSGLQRPGTYDQAQKAFPWVLVGIVFFFIFHNIISSYMVQFIYPLGGDSSDVGIALAISALVEVPTLLSYGRLAARFSHRSLLMVSGLGFTVKPLIMALTSSITGIYLAQFSQIFGYALYVVAILAYTSQIMNPEDASQAQFHINIALTLGGIIGNIGGGYLLEFAGLGPVMALGLATSALGCFFFALGLRPRQEKLAS